MATYPVIKQGWLEYERGWGYRPDDNSLHLSDDDRREFIAEHKRRSAKNPSDSYWYAPDLTPEIIEVNEFTYQVLRKQRDSGFRNKLSRYGVWMFRLYKPERGIHYEPPGWFCKRMQQQGFRVEDFGRKEPAEVNRVKNLAAQEKFATDKLLSVPS